MNQDATQDGFAGGNGGSTTTGFATGTTCTVSGTYRASNKYMDIVGIYAAGDKFLAGADGRKTTWYALTKSLETNKDGGFTSVKVVPGTI